MGFPCDPLAYISIRCNTFQALEASLQPDGKELLLQFILTHLIEYGESNY